MDPFQFIERDGYFYGRATADDGAQAAVWIVLAGTSIGQPDDTSM